MREVLSKLEQVQELDLQIGAILTKKAEFPKRLLGFENEMKTASARQAEKQRTVEELEKGRRQQLGALELNEERAKRSQEKLDQVKTNQEFQALSKEMESLKKNSAVIQENANKVGEELERHKKELAEIEATLAEAKKKYDQEATKISGESQGFEGELSRLNALREKAIEGIDKRYLSAYDRIRGGKGGMGIAVAAGGSCKGCNMRIPPQIYNELQRGTELFSCPSCRRILIYKDAPRAGAQPSA